MNIGKMIRLAKADNELLALAMWEWEKRTGENVEFNSFMETVESIRAYLCFIALSIVSFYLCLWVGLPIGSMLALGLTLLFIDVLSISEIFCLRKRIVRATQDFLRAITLIEKELDVPFGESEYDEEVRRQHPDWDKVGVWSLRNFHRLKRDAENILLSKAGEVVKLQGLPWRKKEADKTKLEFEEMFACLSKLWDINSNFGFYFNGGVKELKPKYPCKA